MPSDQPDLRIESVTGPELARRLAPLAELRIRVFRDFPYLYDGDLAYERNYLQTYVRSTGGVAVLALVGERVVGAATALPLADETPNVQKPFLDAGLDLARVFYLGESVLLPEYRGLGIGHAFFDGREAQARALGGFDTAAFCAVIRPDDHPLRPTAYRPLDAFWRKRGYAPRPDLTCTMTWRDTGAAESTPKPLRFWTRTL